MVNQVNDSFADIDIVLFATDMANEIFKSELELIDNFKKMNVPVILVINKIDTQDDKTKIISRIKDFSDLYDFDAVIPMSVLENDGVDIVFSELEKRTIEGPHFFPDDTLTDQPERVIVAEIIREKVLNLMRDEIPHGTAVVIDKMKDRENSSIVDIDATIICERQSHKGMIIGKGGAMLKKIGTLAREEIETFLDTKVFLNIWVKVSEDWRKKEKIIKDFGFN
jgi:GTP-binding protein Era